MANMIDVKNNVKTKGHKKAIVCVRKNFALTAHGFFL